MLRAQDLLCYCVLRMRGMRISWILWKFTELEFLIIKCFSLKLNHEEAVSNEQTTFLWWTSGDLQQASVLILLFFIMIKLYGMFQGKHNLQHTLTRKPHSGYITKTSFWDCCCAFQSRRFSYSKVTIMFMVDILCLFHYIIHLFIFYIDIIIYSILQTAL